RARSVWAAPRAAPGRAATGPSWASAFATDGKGHRRPRSCGSRHRFQGGGDTDRLGTATGYQFPPAQEEKMARARQTGVRWLECGLAGVGLHYGAPLPAEADRLAAWPVMSWRRSVCRSLCLAAAVAVVGIAPLLAADPGHSHHDPGAVPALPAAVVGPPAVPQNLSPAPQTVEVNLTAAPAALSLLPGTTTPGYAYNGRVPGPTLEVREGDRVIVHFQNNLPEPTTVHWHGIHLPSEMDGSPLNPVAPGEHACYLFTIPPGTAGTYWYHPHPHHRTGFQVAMGLF